MNIINNEGDANIKNEKFFAKVITANTAKENRLNQEISEINKLSSDYESKIEINDNDSSSKGKLDNMKLKKQMDEDKLDTIVTSNNITKHDKEMFDIMIDICKKQNNNEQVDKKTEKYQEFNNWKNEILSRYVA